MEDVLKLTLSQQIYEILKSDIINQKIPCGTKITLKALQERFGLSSTPIREAIKILSNEGLIDEVTNVGAKVISFDETDVKEIYEFCCILDTAALTLSMTNDNSSNFINEIQECIKNQQDSLNNNNIDSFKEHSDTFHDLFFKYAENNRLYTASKRIRSQLSILTTKYQSLSISKSVVVVEHSNIADAISNNNLKLATKLLNKHFTAEKKYLLKHFDEE